MHDLLQDVGQLILAGFDGTALPASVEQSLKEETLGGVILFRRNLEDIEQIAALTQSVYDAAPTLPFVAIDQEGGPVQRIKAPLTTWPPMQEIAASEDANFVAQVGEALNDEIAWLGFNLNFAPVVDIHTNDANPVIGNRAFGTHPKAVSRYAGAFLGGMAIAGVMPCAKHFPGHGDTHTDSHLELPVLHSDLQALTQRELAPFQAMIQAKIPMIMTAHILFPSLDPDHPATLSSPILNDLLRIRLGFDGIVITDDLNMKALADHYRIEEMVERGLEAGVDIFLMCEHEERRVALTEALIAYGERGSLHRQRIGLAAQRVRNGKKAWLRPWRRTAPLLDHELLAQHQALLARYPHLASTNP